MTGKLKIDMKRAMKYAWIATNISLLQLSLGSFVLYPDYFFRNYNAALVLMLLSFPSSIPAVVLAAFFIDGYPPLVYPPFDYTVICLVAFISGCVQWFWCIPRLVKEKEMIRLNLTSPGNESCPIAATDSTHRRKYQPKLRRASFDKRGHSPLERAIGIKRG